MRSQFGMVAALVALMIPTVVAGHAELLRTAPAANSVMSTAPTAVRLSFSEPVESTADAVVVIAPDGARVDGRDAAVPENDRTQVSASVRASSRGTYTVRWRVLSADGHPIIGSFEFSIGTTSVPSTTAQLTPSSRFPRWVQSTGRWLHLLGLALVASPLTLLALIPGTPLGAANLWRLARYGALLTIPAAALLLAGQLFALNGELESALSMTAFSSLLATRWGTLWSARLVTAAVLFGVLAWPRGRVNPRLWLSGLLLSVLLWLTAMNGHSAATNPIALSLAVDWLHLAATVAWVGGLLGLALVALPHSRRAMTAVDTEGAPGAITALAQLVSRFSTLALVSVEVLILTGLYHAWAHVDSPGALTSTTYGITLLIKLGLIAAMLMPAAFNLLLVRPRLARAVSGTDAVQAERLLSRLVRVELVLGAGILVAAAVLTSSPPARAAARSTGLPTEQVAPSPGVTLAESANGVLVLAQLTPGLVGSNQVRLRLQSAGPDTPSGAGVRLRIEPPAGTGMSPWTVTPAIVDNELTATVSLAPAGEWQLHVLLDQQHTVSFAVPVPMRGIGDLLVRADKAMNSLRSLAEHRETVTGSIKTVSDTDYDGPDRARTRSDEGVEIVIGADRYMQHGTMWHRESTKPQSRPRFSYSAAAIEVDLLSTVDMEGMPVAVVAWVDTRDGSRNRLWLRLTDSLVLRHVSMVPGRVVDRGYSSFDRVPRIAPPKGAL